MAPRTIAFDANSLDDAMTAFHRRGYRVVYRDATTVQLIKPRRFNTWAALAWFLVFSVGAVLYIIYFLGQHEKLILLTLNEAGAVQVVDDAPTDADVMLGLAVIGAGVLILLVVMGFLLAI
jgi:hypothetical protein